MFPANKGNANQRRPPAWSILKRNHSCQQQFQPGQHWDFQRRPAPAQKTAGAVTSQFFTDQRTQDLPGWEEQMLTSIPGLPSSRGKSEGHPGAGLHFYAHERLFHIKKGKSSFSCFLHGMDVLRTLLGAREKDQRLRAQLALVPTATPGGVQLSVTHASGYLTLLGLCEYLRWCAHTPTQANKHINKNKS